AKRVKRPLGVVMRRAHEVLDGGPQRLHLRHGLYAAYARQRDVHQHYIYGIGTVAFYKILRALKGSDGEEVVGGFEEFYHEFPDFFVVFYNGYTYHSRYGW